ncbi:ryanodine receptor 1-like, partial [Coturnix japonica]|uniref:ryanodine receptor 1-like n=1 Tax=Coturnix japonica TaxID=93934 RepID=UPI0013A5DBB6
QYYFSVRIFAGQDPSHVWVGWVTPDFHQHDPNFDLTRVRTVTVTMGDDRGNVHDSIKRSNCYMVWGGDVVAGAPQTRSHSDAVIGCLVDVATGLMTFTANGKEINAFFQVEPNTKLFPAVFVLPTSPNVFQFELGKLKNILPISAALFSSEAGNPEPQCPPRLCIQRLTPVTWSRMPAESLPVQMGRAGNGAGWAVSCSEPRLMMALHVPEENRCMDIMELWERQELLRFHWHTLKLYCAVCALGNTRVAHALCSHVDPAQLLFAIQSPDLPGPLRAGYYDLLLAVHLDHGVRTRSSMSSEFIIPMNETSKSITLFPGTDKISGPPGVGIRACLRPKPHFTEPCFIRPINGKTLLGPAVPLRALGRRAIRMLREAVGSGGQCARDPVGGSVEFQLVPVLKLISALLAVGALKDPEVRKVLRMIEPRVFGKGGGEMEQDNEDEEEDEGDNEDKEEEEEEEGPEEGLLQMKLPEPVKLQMCNLLQFFCDQELQHRVEAIVAFSERHVERLQRDQRGRYRKLMAALTMSAAETARRTRISPIPGTLQELISQTMVHWAQESFIQDPELVRSMFSLLHRQYDGLGELVRALPKSYTISCHSVPDTTELLECLGRIRSLLIVQMGPEEENLMIQSIGNIMNNKVFYQHPNLMRALGMHETVMQVMVSVLGGGDSKVRPTGPIGTHMCSMFDHLGYLLENSSIGLGMRGSTPLDVAAASVIDNNELALALKEQDLEKVVTYLASCGLQSCPMLLAKGYPDIGWNPCGGERYLDFLRFAVFVNGQNQDRDRTGTEPGQNRACAHFIPPSTPLVSLLQLIQAGKGEALRIRAILRSLVPLDDLVGVISLPLQIPAFGKAAYWRFDSALANMKGGPTFRLDTTAAFSTTEMALALNRYLCVAVLPLITKCAPLFAGTEHRAIMVDSMLHTVYRLSRGRALTKAQRDAIEECLMALCRYIRPSMLQHLLRRLVFDVPILNEFAKMPLKLLTNHYERCWKYYCLPSGWPNFGVSSEEELHLTRKLFWGIFESLAHKRFDPELYRLAMPCLCAIAGALPPDYVDASYSSKAEKRAAVDAEGNFDPKPVETLK